MEDRFDDRDMEDEDTEEQYNELDTNRRWTRSAALWATDWTAETILSQIEKGHIDLNPKFQRRSVWGVDKQSRYIESLMLEVPVPQLVLAEGKKRGDPYIVIDGKQRLLAIRNFGSNIMKPNFDSLRLHSLSVLKEINQKSYSDLQNDQDYKSYVSDFENASVRTVIIRNWENDDFLYETFLRINTESVRLSPQELRQALYPGKFSEYILLKSTESEEIMKVLNNKGPDKRMRDAELLLRYLAYKNFIGKYNGNLKLFLDETTRIMGKNWKNRQKTVEYQVEQMEEAFRFTRSVFGENYMCKAIGSGNYERRRNRAIVDIMLHYFSCPDVRDSLKGSFKRIEKKFITLCRTEEFRSSIERSTKNMETNRIRFNLWGETIEKISGMDISHMKFPVKP